MRLIPNSARFVAVLAALVLSASCSDHVVPPAAPAAIRPSAAVAAPAQPRASQHVFLFNGAVPADFASQVASLGGTIVRVNGQINVAVTRGLSDANALALAGTSGDVVRDTVVRWVPAVSTLGTTKALAQRPTATSLFPPQTAQFLALQWNMFQIHAPQAWATRTGDPHVRVAILDTGLDPNHVDQFGLIDEAASVAFVPSVTGPPTWQDDFFHGTYVGGLVTSNNFGTAGVAPNVTLVAVKVLDNTGSGSFGDIIGGILYATDAHVQVINMSLGAIFPKNNPGVRGLVAALNRAINYAQKNGVLVVSASGNESVDLQHDQNFIEVPCESGVGLCVSATGITDAIASYSNFGASAIGVAAPGGDFAPVPPTFGFVLSLCDSRSSDPGLAVCADGLHYIFADGTSASAPHVSGLGAYLDSQFGGSLGGSQMITLIQNNADNIGSAQFYGKGRINVVRTVNSSHP